MAWREYWEFLGCYCDLSQPEGLMRLESHLSHMTEQHRTPSNTAQDDSDNAVRQFNGLEDTEDILPEASSAASKQVTDDDLVSAVERLSLGAREETEMSEEMVRDEEVGSFTSPHEVVGGFTTPVRGTRDYIMAPSLSTPLARVYITG